MTIMFRYILRETSKYLLMVVALVITLTIIIDYISHADKFIAASVSWKLGVYYVLLRIPFIIGLIGPVTVLLAVLIVFSLMGKNRETLALSSSGVSPFSLFKPVLIVGIVSSVGLFLVSNFVVPPTIQEANRIEHQKIRKDQDLFIHKDNTWIKDTKMIGLIGRYDPMRQRIFGVELNFFDDDFNLAQRIEAKEGTVKKGFWELADAIVLSKRDDKQYVARTYKMVRIPMKFSPENLTDVVQRSEEMSVSDIYQYILRIEREGYDATYYRVELQSKFAFPLACIIMCLIAVGVSARTTNRTGGFAIGVTIGICAAFAYWLLHSFCLSLGYSGQLPPTIAAWTANALFLCVGAVLLQGMK